MHVQIANVPGLTGSDGAFSLDLGPGPISADTLKVGDVNTTEARNLPFIAEKLRLLLEHDVYAGVNNVIRRPIYLPELDVANKTPVEPDKVTIATTSAIPELSLTIAAGTLMDQQGMPYTGNLTITEVPTALTPVALPANLRPDVVVTIQPGEMFFASSGAPITFPNRGGYTAGTLFDLWSIDPVEGDFKIAGKMRVSSDGQRIETISGGVHNSSWHFPAPATPQPDDETQEPGCNCSCDAPATSDSDLDPLTGAQMVTSALAGYQSLGVSRGLTLRYDSLRASPGSVLQFSQPVELQRFPAGQASQGSPRLYAQATIKAGNLRYPVPGGSITNGPPLENASFGTLPALQNGDRLHGALYADLSTLPSGIYGYELSAGLGTLRNGSLIGSAGLPVTGTILNVNSIDSPFGSGWGLAGLQQIVVAGVDAGVLAGSVVIIDGDGKELLSRPDSQGGYISPHTDFSTLEELTPMQGGGFKRTLTDGTIHLFGSNLKLASVTDRNLNQTKYDYDGDGRLILITDPVGQMTGQVTTLVYGNNQGKLLSEIELPDGRKTLFDTDGSGNLTKITNPDGTFTQYGYDARHRLITETTPRAYQKTNWYDGAGRMIATANYGNNGGAALTRPATVPARSDTVLVTTTEYNIRGEAYRTIDPAGRDDRVEFGHAGRQTKTIQNYVDGDPTTPPSTPDQDVTVQYTYNADGRIATIKARQQITGNDQTTTYTYGVTLTGGSAFVSNDLLAKVTYPDGSTGSTDNVTYQYNRQGQVIKMTDQIGSVHTYDYDRLGRQLHDRVTTLGANVDPAVKRISTTYEVRGLVSKITSYDNAVVGSGNVVNEVQNDYNNFGQLVTQWQEHAAGGVTGSSRKVQYAYADGSANHVRPTNITYPSGRVLNYNYVSASGDADNLSRVVALVDSDGSTHLADYTYLGLGMVVKVDYVPSSVRLDLAFGAGSDPYDGLDQFDRVKELPWTKYSTPTADFVRIKHGYDRAGNRLWREDPVAAANSKNFDELYSYDGVYRLKSFKRGDLNANKDGINTGTLTFQHDWVFDPLGNWTTFTEDADGVGGPDFTQTRLFNRANEITSISNVAPPSPPPTAWPTPVFDRNGNMTTMPQPAALTSSFTATYDAWNRLVKLASGGSTVVTYKYDGQNWRTTTITASPAETREHYYSSNWQVLEERVGASLLDRQFIWGIRYIDDLVRRERDTNADGILDQKHGALQDANWNMAAIYIISAPTPAVMERYAYTAYGNAQQLSSTFLPQVSTYFWETRYAGYRWDAASSLLHVRNRDLHSPLGRWEARDPIDYDGGSSNLYEYGHASPVQNTDPNGTWVFHAACATACAGCTGVPAIALTTCYFNSTNAKEFKVCWDYFWGILPTWHKILFGTACVGCAACLVRYAWQGVVVAARVIKPRIPPRPPAPPRLPTAPVVVCLCSPVLILPARPIGPPIEQCPTPCWLIEQTLTPPCWCIYNCGGLLIRVPVPPTRLR